LQDLQESLVANTSCWTYKIHLKNKAVQDFKNLLYEKEGNGKEAILN